MERAKRRNALIAQAAEYFGITESEVQLMRDVSHNNHLILRINSTKHLDSSEKHVLLTTLQEELAAFRKELGEKYPNQVTFDHMGWATTVKSSDGKTNVDFMSQEEMMQDCVWKHNYLLDQTTYSHNKEKLPEILAELEGLKKILKEKHSDTVTFKDGVAVPIHKPSHNIAGLEDDELNTMPEGIELNRNPDLNRGKDVKMTITPVEQKYRYNVGETIYGICFFFGGVTPTIGFKHPYIFDNEEPTDIKIVPLTVRVHHKVADSNDPSGEKKYDGFVLTDPQGNTWHNQYPYASYGQLSDEGNRRFRRYVQNPEHGQKMRDNNEVIHCHLLSDYYRNVVCGIREFEKPEVREKANNKEDFDRRHALLVTLRDKISAQLLADHQMVLKERDIWPGVEGATDFYVDAADTAFDDPEEVAQVKSEQDILIDKSIEDYGFFMMGVPGTAFYSVGFFMQNQPELILSIGDPNLVNMFDRICRDYARGFLPIDKIFNSKWAKVNGEPARCIIRLQEDDGALWIHENLATEVKKRHPDLCQYAILQLPDGKNRLPHEDGYNLGDQSISMIQYNLKGLNKSSDS